ncbi:MAG: hypothetical protein JRN67_10815 [Nitrososphaerota archaeon]|nr:hypothetical protein [Nitrososphaerota archaeon]
MVKKIHSFVSDLLTLVFGELFDASPLSLTIRSGAKTVIDRDFMMKDVPISTNTKPIKISANAGQ